MQKVVGNSNTIQGQLNIKREQVEEIINKIQNT